MVVIRDKEILNLDSLERDFGSLKSKRFKLGVPSLDVQKDADSSNFDALRKDIFEIANQFPHRRITLIYKTINGEIHLELHPVTGAA